ncbi:Hsp20/alpha crystallin family protein [Fictibacillus sp. KIGAM418]|uniref:Hsp20/alpha crystallin family protein n=1 Tax=Fictibacillus marinisediminis TaxID=2878389 RepID=A0A9X1XAP9_9BACL|nr:Hsp20/alpha crystallin family protein [Fictibacillus marinisediminis]MCK6257387.1 Hsp20/alpha crystallin family protein [Fictibacillus marinisediminis]
MSLIPYESFRKLDNMRKELNRFFPFDIDFPQNNDVLKMDVYETDNEVVATVDIPGVEKKEDLTIKIENNNVLSISGIINRANEVKNDHMYTQERFTGRFERSIRLPTPVAAEKEAKATYKNGVLEIRMLKLHDQENDQKQIGVEFH